MIKASEKLKRSEERYALALKGRQAGIYEWFVAEDRVELSEHWKNLLGYQASEIGFISLDIFLGMVHPDDVARTSTAVQRHMVEKTPYQNEVRLKTRDGSYRWFQDTGIAKTDADGRLQVVIGAIIDIHDRKLAEEKILLQNELLAKANKELDHFVYSVSHDLRAPLSSILGLTHIYTLAKDQTERDGIVSMVNDRAQVLDRFIREVLDYSRNTRLELHMQPVVVAEVVQDLLKGLDHMDGIESVTIETDIPKDASIVTDRERLKVILSNLLANAVHYRDPSKKSFIRILGRVSDGILRMDIEDNGIGIRAEHQDRIFEMFYKAHDHSEGTGLGLYIVMETVQRLKGTIDVRSEYTVGTTFMLKVPDNGSYDL
jgi:PAS domain S-box-containing protein